MADFAIGKRYRGKGTNESVIARAIAAMQQISGTELTKRYIEEGEELAREMTLAGNFELGGMGDFMADNLLGIQSRSVYDMRTDAKGNRTRDAQIKRDRQGKIIEPPVPIQTQVFMQGMRAMTLTRRVDGQRIKLTNQPFDLKKIHQGRLEWPQLKFNTLKRKERAGRANPSGFFTDSGDLYNYFKNNVSDAILAGTGGVEVTFDSSPFKAKRIDSTLTINRPSYREQFGRLRIRIAPRVTPAGLPALASGEWDDDSNERMPIERRLMPAWVIKKLGRNLSGEYFRPLFQPTLAFWLLHRIPRTISMKMYEIMNIQKQRK